MRPLENVHRLSDVLDELELDRHRDVGAAAAALITCSFCSAVAIRSCPACDVPLCEDDGVGEEGLCPDCRGWTP